MRKYEYSDELANAVDRFLIEDDWNYSFDSDKGVFDFNLNVKSKLRKIRYLIDIKKSEIIVYGICPVGADPKDKEEMAEMAEFICRANYGLRNGNFEFDFRDGEIRFKSFIDCDGMIPPSEVIKDSIYCTAAMFRRYGDGVASILFAGCSAQEAIEQCEKSPSDELRRLLDSMRDGENVQLSDLLAQRLAERLSDGGDDDDDDDDDEMEPFDDDAESSGDSFD